jgi:hypothetical protein
MVTADTMTADPALATAGFATPDPEIEATVDHWLREYVSRPHPELGRSGAVCPFVAPAMRVGSLAIAQHTGLARTGPAHLAEDELRELIHRMARDFEEREWAHSNATLHSLVLVLPDLPPSRWSALDRLQAELKAELADRGLMLGQFHPQCPEPAARNPFFAVSRSPVPLLAMRRMALHDVLFLQHDRGYFAAYRRRFADRYEQGTVTDPLFRDAYQRASDAFSLPGASPRSAVTGHAVTGSAASSHAATTLTEKQT